MTQTDDLFRQQALRQRVGVEGKGQIVRSSAAGVWAFLVVLACALLMGLALSIFGHVEVSSRCRGILRPAGGVRILTAQASGVVAAVFTASGRLVASERPILRLDSAQARAALLEAERQLAFLEAHETVWASVNRWFDQELASLGARSGSLEEQAASINTSLGLHENRLRTHLELAKSGLVSSTTIDDDREAIEQLRRGLGSNRQAFLQAEQELAALHGEHERQLRLRQQELSAAKGKRDALAVAIQQSIVVAPTAGYVEAILVRPGDVVQMGEPLGKLIPKDSPLEVICFLSERDRAFAKVGDVARLELDQFPYGEFGTLSARIGRISDDLASPYEIREAFGEDLKLESSSYRVVLRLKPRPHASRIQLRSGMLMNVRFSFRRQRLIALVFEPLSRWLR